LTRFRFAQGIAVVILAGLMADVASAQAPGGGGRGNSRGGDTPRVGPAKPIDPESSSAMTMLSAVQYRLELLEEDLRLQPDQRGAWQAYRERVLRLAEDSQRTARMALESDLPAPKRLDRLADIARDRLTAIEDIVDAGKSLYAVLTPGQKAVADRRLAVPVTALAGVEPNSAAARAGTAGKNP
jgi:hypothetical protein